jgi:hypothetical protein
MRYILDDNGYIDSVSCTPFNCKDKSCQEYTGTIPDGYLTLDEWALNANIRAYKIVDNNLVYDEAKDTTLQEEWALLVEDSNIIINFSPNNASAYDFYGGCYYYKKGTRVHIHLGLSNLPNDRVEVFVLPVGYRPYSVIAGVSMADNLTTKAGYEVYTNGYIAVNSGYGYMIADIEFDAFR